MTYAVTPDPYCYADSSVLKNLLNLRDQASLEAFEARVYKFRAQQPLPSGRFSATHYRAFHHHLFHDVYAWAGRYRTVRIAKDNSMFCYPEHIKAQMDDLFADLRTRHVLKGLPADAFAVELAHFLATLNAIHPFREGNGRTQLIFCAALAAHAGHPLALEALNPQTFLEAMISSFAGDEAQLAGSLRSLLTT